MATTRLKPYDSFGPYILFRRLEEDSLGEVWRAGKIEGGTVHTVALHRLTGGNAEALQGAANFAKASATLIGGTSIVRNQVIEVIQGHPVIVHDYNGGRSLRHIIAKAQNPSSPNPMAPDQALAIAEKVAAAVELVHNFRRDGSRAVHGAVVPRFVWIEEDGEIRTAGQQLGKGLIASLSSAAISREIGPYIAPEVRSFGEPSAAGDIYAVGAILFLALTGTEPPDPAHGQFAEVLARAMLMTDEPIPQEIRAILQKSFAPDINARYSSAADLRRDLHALSQSGAYAPTTFNLAFYLSTLLKNEFETEATEREKESKVNPAAFLGAAPPAAAAAPSRSAATGPVLTAPRRRSRAPLAAAGVALLALSAFGGYWVLTRDRNEAQAAVRVASATPLGQQRQGAPPATSPQLITAAPAGTSTAPIAASAEEAERKRRIEEEVQRRLQEEMMKLQSEYERGLARERAAAQAAASRAAERPVERRESQLAGGVQREETRMQPVEESPRPASVEPVQSQTATTNTAPPLTVAPPPTQQVQPLAQPAIQQAPAQQTILEGDLVGFDQLDVKPQPRGGIRPVYPPIALRQKLQSNVLLSALISETGQVLEVKVLRGDGRRLGFDEAAVRAVRASTFSPAMKGGRRVRTWLPVPIRFKP